MIRNERLIKEIEEKYYNEIYNFSKKELDIPHNFDFNVENIFFFDKLEDKFEGYLDVRIYKIDSYEDERTHYTSYKLNVEGSYNQNGVSLKFISINENDFVKNGKTWLDENFIPSYSKEEYAFLASEIRITYLPNKKLTDIIDEKELAQALGLTILHRKLSKDGSIFSALCIEETKVNVYNDGQVTEEIFPAKTIIVDDFAINLYGGDKSEKFNVLHECVHYILHQKFYYCRIRSGDYKGFFCYTDGSLNNFVQKSYSNIEAQANGITANLLLPEKELIGHFEGFKKLNIYSNECDNTYYAINECCKIFNVSIETMLIRLKMLGGSNLIGLHEYVNGKYVNPYLFHDVNCEDITFSISNNDFMVLYATDMNFRDAINSGSFLYVDSHICLNDEKYYYINDNGNPELTDYARNNIQECCLYFTYKCNYDNITYSNFDYMLYRKRKYKTSVEIRYPYPQDIKIPDKSYAYELSRELSHLNGSFKDDVKWLYQDRNITQETLAELSDLSIDTIKHLDNGTLKPINITKLCIGMKLPPIISHHLFSKTKYDINSQDQMMMTCRVALETLYNHKIEDVIKFFEDNDQR